VLEKKVYYFYIVLFNCVNVKTSFMDKKLKTIEELVKLNEELVEVELMLTTDEFKSFAAFCIKKDVKFNDWIRKLAQDALKKDA